MIYLASLQEEINEKLDGVVYIHTRTELDHYVLYINEISTVRIKPDFVGKYFTPFSLKEYIDQAKKVNININFEIDNLDLVDTTSEYAIVRKMERALDMDEMLDVIMHNPKLSMSVLKNLCQNYVDEVRQDLNYNSQISTLQKEVVALQGELDDQKHKVRNAEDLMLQYQSKLHDLVSRINYTYDKNILEKSIFNVQQNRYDMVLYFKEYSRVQYTDTFIYYLQQILTTMLSMPCRLTVIEPFYADCKIPQYPNLVPHHLVTEEDVMNGNVLQLGLQPRVMEAIMKNSSNVSFLIVLDRSGYSKSFLTGDRIEYFFIASDKKDIPEGIPLSRCITYDKDTLFIQYDRDFDTWDSTKKVQFYSSMNTTKVILKLVC